MPAQAVTDVAQSLGDVVHRQHLHTLQAFVELLRRARHKDFRSIPGLAELHACILGKPEKTPTLGVRNRFEWGISIGTGNHPLVERSPVTVRHQSR